MILMVLIAALLSVIEMRDRELAARKPVSLDDLDKLVQPVGSSSNDTPLNKADSARPASEELAQEMANAPSVRLEGCLAPELLVERFKANSTGRLLKEWVKGEIVKAYDSVPSVVGMQDSGGDPYYLGKTMMTLGKWDAARRYFWEALERPSMSPDMRKDVCAKLAWLEDDPERAARLLELSCQEDRHGSQLRNAIYLCQKTESNALADHYLARLRTEHPEVARKYFGDDLRQIEHDDGLE